MCLSVGIRPVIWLKVSSAKCRNMNGDEIWTALLRILDLSGPVSGADRLRTLNARHLVHATNPKLARRIIDSNLRAYPIRAQFELFLR